MMELTKNFQKTKLNKCYIILILILNLNLFKTKSLRVDHQKLFLLKHYDNCEHVKMQQALPILLMFF